MSNEKNKAEGVEKAAGQNYYDKRINIASGSDSETYRLGAAFGAHWQRNDPAFIAEIIEKTLAYVGEHGREVYSYSATIEEEKYGLLTMQPDVVNQILKEKV